MSLLKCPKCGEMFSDTYHTCPFCAEDEELFYDGKKSQNPGRRVESAKSPRIFGPAMIVVLVLLAAVLVYVFLVGRSGTQQGDESANTQQTETAETAPLSLDQTELTLTEGDTAVLTASGGSGSVTWTSSDETVTTVADDGTVTAVGAGSAAITAVAGDESVACTVTVEAEPEPEPEPEPEVELAIVTDYGTPSKNSYGHWEFTAGVGDTFGLRVSGTDDAVTWSTSDSSVATVADDGTFQAVGSGRATLTATVDGQTLKCDVIVG